MNEELKTPVFHDTENNLVQDTPLEKKRFSLKSLDIKAVTSKEEKSDEKDDKIDKSITPFSYMIESLKKKKCKCKDSPSYDQKSARIINKVKNSIAKNNSPDSDTLEDTPTSTPRIKKSRWTKDIEKEVTDFANLCSEEATELRGLGFIDDFIAKGIKTLVVIEGATSAYLAASDITDTGKQIALSILGASSGVATSILGIFNFQKKATLAQNSSNILNRIARKLRMTVLQPEKDRIDPLKLIMTAETEKDLALTNDK
jgi:hypothetical protein